MGLAFLGLFFRFLSFFLSIARKKEICRSNRVLAEAVSGARGSRKEGEGREESIRKQEARTLGEEGRGEALKKESKRRKNWIRE